MSENKELNLTRTVSYLLAKPVESEEVDEYEINVTDIHRVMSEVQEGLEKSINAKVKFHTDRCWF